MIDVNMQTTPGGVWGGSVPLPAGVGSPPLPGEF